MPTRTANASGTVKNTGDIPCTYRANLYAWTFDYEDRLQQTLNTFSELTLEPGATSTTISLSKSGYVPAGGYMRAQVVLDITAPAAYAKQAVATSITVTSPPEPATTGGTWTGTPTITRLVGHSVEGEFALEVTQGGGGGGPLLVTLGGLVGIIAAAFRLRRR